MFSNYSETSDYSAFRRPKRKSSRSKNNYSRSRKTATESQSQSVQTRPFESSISRSATLDININHNINSNDFSNQELPNFNSNLTSVTEKYEEKIEQLEQENSQIIDKLCSAFEKLESITKSSECSSSIISVKNASQRSEQKNVQNYILPKGVVFTRNKSGIRKTENQNQPKLNRQGTDYSIKLSRENTLVKEESKKIDNNNEISTQSDKNENQVESTPKLFDLRSAVLDATMHMAFNKMTNEESEKENEETTGQTKQILEPSLLTRENTLVKEKSISKNGISESIDEQIQTEAPKLLDLRSAVLDATMHMAFKNLTKDEKEGEDEEEKEKEHENNQILEPNLSNEHQTESPKPFNLRSAVLDATMHMAFNNLVNEEKEDENDNIDDDELKVVDQNQPTIDPLKRQNTDYSIKLSRENTLTKEKFSDSHTSEGSDKNEIPSDTPKFFDLRSAVVDATMHMAFDKMGRDQKEEEEKVKIEDQKPNNTNLDQSISMLSFTEPSITIIQPNRVDKPIIADNPFSFRSKFSERYDSKSIDVHNIISYKESQSEKQNTISENINSSANLENEIRIISSCTISTQTDPFDPFQMQSNFDALKRSQTPSLIVAEESMKSKSRSRSSGNNKKIDEDLQHSSSTETLYFGAEIDVPKVELVPELANDVEIENLDSLSEKQQESTLIIPKLAAETNLFEASAKKSDSNENKFEYETIVLSESSYSKEFDNTLKSENKTIKVKSRHRKTVPIVGNPPPKNTKLSSNSTSQDSQNKMVRIGNRCYPDQTIKKVLDEILFDSKQIINITAENDTSQTSTVISQQKIQNQQLAENKNARVLIEPTNKIIKRKPITRKNSSSVFEPGLQKPIQYANTDSSGEDENEISTATTIETTIAKEPTKTKVSGTFWDDILLFLLTYTF